MLCSGSNVMKECPSYIHVKENKSIADVRDKEWVLLLGKNKLGK